MTVLRTPSPTQGCEEPLLAVTQELMPRLGWGADSACPGWGQPSRRKPEWPFNRDVRAHPGQ